MVLHVLAFTSSYDLYSPATTNLCFLHAKHKGFHEVYLEPDKFHLLLAYTWHFLCPLSIDQVCRTYVPRMNGSGIYCSSAPSFQMVLCLKCPTSTNHVYSQKKKSTIHLHSNKKWNEHHVYVFMKGLVNSSLSNRHAQRIDIHSRAVPRDNIPAVPMIMHAHR